MAEKSEHQYLDEVLPGFSEARGLIKASGDSVKAIGFLGDKFEFYRFSNRYRMAVRFTGIQLEGFGENTDLRPRTPHRPPERMHERERRDDLPRNQRFSSQRDPAGFCPQAEAGQGIGSCLRGTLGKAEIATWNAPTSFVGLMR